MRGATRRSVGVSPDRAAAGYRFRVTARLVAIVVLALGPGCRFLRGDWANRSGTCFYVSRSGIVLTSLHVVHDARRVWVIDQSGVRSTAEVIRVDPEVDLAALQVYSAHTTTFLPIAADDAALGDRVYTIDPSSWRRDAGLVVGQRGLGSADLLSTTTHAVRGSSGGPLVNASGEVIGLLVRLNRTDKVAFAVKASAIRRTIHDLPPPARAAPDRARAIERTRGAVCSLWVH